MSRNNNAYYVFTVLYVLLMPISITVFLPIIPIIFPGFPLSIAKGLFLASPLFVAIAMFLYTYLYIGNFKLMSPDSLLGLYIPVLIYFVWKMFISIIYALFSTPDYDSVLSYALMSLNGYDIDNTIDNKVGWHLHLLMSYVYNLAIVSGFIAGERLAFYKTKVMRKAFPKYFWLILLCGVVILLISEGTWFYKQRNIMFY